jgi:hypothetical protein
MQILIYPYRMPNRSRLWLALAAAAIAAAGAVALRAQEQPPDFRSGVEVATFEFRAFGPDGVPITDLRAAEVDFKVDGRPRALKSMQWIQVALPLIEGAPPPETMPPPFGSNTRADAGRGVIVVLENESLKTGREAPLRRAINRFLDGLSPRDRVALVTMPYGGIKVDFTIEHDKVAQAVGLISGQATRPETGSDMACRTRRTLESLAGLLEGLGSSEAPTTIMFFTTALAGPRRDAPVTLAPGPCELTAEHFQQVGAAATLARAQFYLIQPEDPSLVPGAVQTENIAGANFRGSDNPLEGIEHLAGVTGARRLHLSTAGDDSLRRVLDETTGYYLLAFEPERADRNGLRRRVDLYVTRAGTMLRSMPNLVLPRADARRAVDTPHTMLRAPKVFRELPLRAVGFTSRDVEGKVKVIVMAEPIESGVELRSAATAMFDGNGRLAAQNTADAAALSATPLVTGLVAPPGDYRLRVAATAADGRTGTADYDLAAELSPAGALSLSSIMLGLSRAGGFSPRLQFTNEPVALAYLEVYGASAGTPITVALELATTPNGPARLTIPGAVSESRSGERRLATIAIPIGALPPGDYVVRAVVSMEGQPAGRVSRTLRKVRM